MPDIVFAFVSWGVWAAAEGRGFIQIRSCSAVSSVLIPSDRRDPHTTPRKNKLKMRGKWDRPNAERRGRGAAV